MSGVRVDRPLTLAATFLFVCGTAGAAPIWQKFGLNFDAVKLALTTTTSPAPGKASQPKAKPAEAPIEAALAMVNPPASTERRVAAWHGLNEAGERGTATPVVPAMPDQLADQAAPLQPVAPIEGDEVPIPATVAPALREAPAASSQPPAAYGGDEVPTPAAAAKERSAPSPVLAAPPGEVLDPTATVGPDALIADALRDLADDKFERLVGGEKERATFRTFYSGRSYAPLWLTDGKVNARAEAAIAYLRQVDADGLDPADYQVPDFSSLADPVALAEAEIALSARVVTYAYHAQVGRVHWTRVSGDIFYELKPSTPADVLANLADAKDVAAALAAYEPVASGYVALKSKLAELRARNSDAEKAPIPKGPVLKVGMEDERVPQLRERLGVIGDGLMFDKTLADAVKKSQREHELNATGSVTMQTVEALNGRRPDRQIDTIIANMERWRWMPHDLGKIYVMVNLPDFMLHVIQNDGEIWTTKVVDGKPETPTPIMSADLKSITVNPTWNIPDTIAAKEYVPLMRQDPTILERMGLAVTRGPDNIIHISQPPGPNNALGQLRFNFPNKFFVYQHDSNEKYLFAKRMRASSHGCMRIENPVKYAEILLAITRPREGYSEDRIRGMFGSNEIEIRLPISIPVHLTYQTVFVDQEGKTQFRDDVYGRDKALLAILKGDERGVADIPIERKDNVVRREALAVPDQLWHWGGQNFFARLFAPLAGQPPAPHRPGMQR